MSFQGGGRSRGSAPPLGTPDNESLRAKRLVGFCATHYRDLKSVRIIWPPRRLPAGCGGWHFFRDIHINIISETICRSNQIITCQYDGYSSSFPEKCVGKYAIISLDNSCRKRVCCWMHNGSCSEKCDGDYRGPGSSSLPRCYPDAPVKGLVYNNDCATEQQSPGTNHDGFRCL